MMIDLTIKNGTVVNAGETEKIDAGVKDGKIVLLGDSSLFPESRREIDAGNQYVMPGMIDAHVHINPHEYREASLAAAYGGTTTMIEMAIPDPGESTLQAVERRMLDAKRSVIDYSFHACIKKGNAQSYKEIADLLTSGITSVKMFTVYRNEVMVDMGTIHEVFKILQQHGGLAVIHAESAEIFEYNIKRFAAQGKTTPPYHAMSRPPLAEVQAIAGLLPFVQKFEVPTLFVHIAAPQVKDYLQAARPAWPIFTEVCTHYLTLTEEVYSRPDGEKFYCCPPMRTQEDQDGLWSLLQEGLVDLISSDHSGFSKAQKERYKDNFTLAPYGLPGIETRGTVLFSEGVVKRKITANQFVALTSANTAKVMGIYPQKGIIAIGSDADLVIFDPSTTHTVAMETLHMPTDYTPFSGLKVTGKPVHRLLRGRFIIENGRDVAELPPGNLVRRKQPVFN